MPPGRVYMIGSSPYHPLVVIPIQTPSQLVRVANLATMQARAQGMYNRMYAEKSDEDKRYWRWLLRLGTFVVYAGFAIALLVVSSGKSPCYVQSTYKQEFLSKVVANPFYSSSQIIKQGPKSQYEVNRSFALPFTQHASDISIFPVIPLDPLGHAAFWPVEPMPNSMLAMGGAMNILPSASMVDGVYYYDEASKRILATGLPPAGGTGPVLASMTLQSISGPIKVGSVLPNIARCVKPLPVNNPQPSDVEEWLNSVKHVASNSHLRGTCLLTGQQATVDVTSNYKTSLTTFSSVNMLFMLSVIMWISASFALFYVGGLPRNGAADPASFGMVYWSSADFFILTSIVWNIFLVVYILVPRVQEQSNIPLNNVVVALMALLSSIAVQWYWANFSGRRLIPASGAPAPAAPAAVSNWQDATPLLANGGDQRGSDMMNPALAFFDTRNFLSVASSVQQRSKFALETVSLEQGGVVQKMGAPFANADYYRVIKASCICHLTSFTQVQCSGTLLGTNCTLAQSSGRLAIND